MKNKSKSLPTPDDLTLDEIMEKFSTDAEAREYLESIRWPHGVICPHCQNTCRKQGTGKIWRITPNKEKGIREGLYQCGECEKQFSVTVNTVFESSHLSLRKWLIAWYLICSSKKGISSLQLQRILGLGSYRSALFLSHRIRHAMKDPIFTKPLAGTVEIDETFVGGYQSNEEEKAKGSNKTPVVSLVERDGNVRSFVMQKLTAKNLKQAVEDHVAPYSAIVTDSATRLKGVGKKYHHYRVNHSAKEYARRINDKFVAHSNTVESSFSLLKRGVIGTFHSISRKHLHLYLAEFDHRWNTRKETDGARTVRALKKAEGKRLTYKPLTDKEK